MGDCIRTGLTHDPRRTLCELLALHHEHRVDMAAQRAAAALTTRRSLSISSHGTTPRKHPGAVTPTAFLSLVAASLAASTVVLAKHPQSLEHPPRSALLYNNNTNAATAAAVAAVASTATAPAAATLRAGAAAGRTTPTASSASLSAGDYPTRTSTTSARKDDGEDWLGLHLDSFLRQ